MIVVTFHKDGTAETIESKSGISFLVANLVDFNIKRIYVAKSQADAKIAIDKWAKVPV